MTVKETTAVFTSVLWATIFAAHTATAVTVVDFEELSFPGGLEFYAGSVLDDGFTSRDVRFSNHFTDFGNGCCWEGFAYSRATDTSTPGPANQYSAYPGGGADDSTNYAVVFSGYDAGNGGLIPTITLPPGARPVSLRVANTTYAALSMRHGDGFAKQFGGESGDEEDWFLLRIEARDEDGMLLGQVETYLADFRFADSALDYIANSWLDVDLSSLAALPIDRLELRFDSSDVDASLGINTPVYAAIDNLTFELTNPGDFNGDLVVDASDYTVWRDSLGQPETLAGGDANGVVDAGDYAMWKMSFGTSYVAGAFKSATVPEPATAWIMAATCILLARRAIGAL